MDYLETVAYIESLAPTLENPSLTRITAFLSEHGNPQNEFPSIVVGGTNGKGSTVAILDSILRRSGNLLARSGPVAGARPDAPVGWATHGVAPTDVRPISVSRESSCLKAGRFTGPHLLRWNERFHLDGQPISDETFAQIATEVRRMSELFGQKYPELGSLTWFEFLTAVCFFFFAQEKIDIAVMEVGLGGRFDATNILNNVLSCAITNVSLDHTRLLGDSIGKIAFEKAGIVKAGIPVVTGCTGEALDIVISQAKKLGSDLFCCMPPYLVRKVSQRLGQPQLVKLPVDDWQKVLSLLGEHQTANALVALTALTAARERCMTAMCDKNMRICHFLQNREQLAVAIREGLGNVYWPGRMQFIRPLNLLMDGAHNPAGAQALRTAIDQIFGDCKRCFVVSCYENKNVNETVAALVRPGDRFFASEAATRRKTYPKEQLAKVANQCGARARVFPTLNSAFTEVLRNNDSRELIIATGSFSTVRELMLYLGWSKLDDGRGADND